MEDAHLIGAIREAHRASTCLPSIEGGAIGGTKDPDASDRGVTAL
jgi:hypothetical protein